jgi:hypothetical protein
MRFKAEAPPQLDVRLASARGAGPDHFRTISGVQAEITKMWLFLRLNKQFHFR